MHRNPRPRWPRLALLMVVLLAQGLAGCIGGADRALDPARVSAGPDAAHALVGPIIHQAPVHGTAPTPTLLDQSGAGLPGAPGVPLPVAIEGHTGAAAFEPTIGVTPDGALFMAATDVRDNQAPLVVRSLDSGATWTDVTPRIGQDQVFPAMTFDPYVHVDPDTGRVFDFNMIALTCNTLSFSDDGGASWTHNPVACGQPVGVQDHQTLWTSRPRALPTVAYDNVVHYCVNRIADAACAFSLDGGLTWSPLRPLVYEGVSTERTDVHYGTPLCSALTAHGTAGPDGTIYLPRGHCGTPTVAISEDDGLTWTTVPISHDVPMYHERVDDPMLGNVSVIPEHEVAFALDAAGNAYALWISMDRKPYLAVSGDGGWTWEAPRMVAPPGVGNAAFPALAAGDEGRIALAYYGTTAGADYANVDELAPWHLVLSVSVGATSDEPVFVTSAANDLDDPVARGACGNTRCPSDYGVGDFIDLVVGPDGRPWVAYVDVCLAACVDGDDSSDGNVGAVATLRQGPALRGPLAALDPLDWPRATAGPAVAPAEAGPGYETFRLSGQATLHANGCKCTFAVDEDELTYWVGRNATAAVFELAWQSEASDLYLQLFRGAGPVATVGGGADVVLPDGRAGWREVITEEELLRHGPYDAWVRGNLAVAENVELAVTLFYGERAPGDFTALP